MPDLVVYMRPPSDWVEDIHVHFWDREPGQEATQWPGVPIQRSEDGWYRYCLADTRLVRLVFHDGHGKQTRDLFRDRDGWLDRDGVWYESQPPAG